MQPRYVEFEGQEFCALRSRLNDGPCCPNRIDECSVPIGDNRTGWTKCYCDEFCDRRFNPDCCPDYESVCKGRKSVKTCNLDGKVLQILQEAKVDCNLWWNQIKNLREKFSLKMFKTFNSKCRSNGRADCEDDPCLADAEMVKNINRDKSILGWTAHAYTEFIGRKLKEGLTYRLGTFEPRVRVKSMSRLSNRLEMLPKQFNSLINWSSLISQIRDQGWCG